MSQVRWLDDREERAWRALILMHDRLKAALARDLATHSALSYPDYEVLVGLTDQPDDRMRPYELRELLGWEQSRLSHHLRRMDERGLVKKVPCETDRRGSYIAVTAKGRRSIEAAAPGHVEAVRRLFIDHASTRELEAISNLAQRVLTRLASGSSDAPSGVDL